MESEDYKYFKLRKEGKIYISKVFSFDGRTDEPIRFVRIVFENNDQVLLGEIEGAMCLRLSGNKRKTQVSAIISQDHKNIKRLTLETFKQRTGDTIEAIEKNEFTFRGDEFRRLCDFLTQINFIDLSNEDNFHIEDISEHRGPKTIIDAPDRHIIDYLKSMPKERRGDTLDQLGKSLDREDINILLGRRQSLAEFEQHILGRDWREEEWQHFFSREQWVFGYGLDYRVMRQFDREMTVGSAGTDNQNKPIIDFLETFTDYTVLVEIKTPNTPIFKSSRGGRAGTWDFSSEFIGAVSQIIEQKAKWLAFAEGRQHYDKSGSRTLSARTRNAKSILVIGSISEFSGNARDCNIMKDTFELFRRETRSIDIVTFDELFERAQFITKR